MKKFILLIVLILFANGCRNVKEIKTYSSLKALRGHSIEFITLDSTVYRGELVDVIDNSILIKGYKIRQFSREHFFGEIPFEEIFYIQTGDEELLPIFLKAGLTAFIIASPDGLIPYLPEMTSDVKYIYPGGSGSGGTSCPYVYSWNGNEFRLEGETFGIALGRALEAETAVMLTALKPEGNKLIIKFTNERPETHFFNTVKLFAIESPPGSLVYPDNKNNFRIINEKSDIIRANDNSSRDITSELIQEDKKYWQSDLSSANIASGFEDMIYLSLNPEGDSDSLSLIVNAINTEISAVVFDYLLKELGKDYVSFTRSVETNPEMINIMKEMLRRTALKAEVWNGIKWEYVDLIYPEANFISFSKIVRLPVIKNEAGEMHIRLRALSDLWKIDYIGYDNSDSPMPVVKEVQLLSSDGAAENIKYKDELYIKLLPGEELNMEYKEAIPKDGMKIFYAAKAGGFLYEYLICEGEENINPLDNINPDFAKLEIVKFLFNNQDLFLPMIYNQWKEKLSYSAIGEGRNF